LAFILKISEGGEIKIKRKIFWFVISFLMMLSLVITSCGQAIEEEEEEEEEGQVVITKEEQEEQEEEKEELVSSDKPQYGGTHCAATALPTK
jgi:hypothetical protein